jgi:menaquinone-dependent protoporphyrinogen oxidase
MARMLVVYGTTEGHTRTVATRIGEWIEEAGEGAVVIDSAAALPGLLEESEYDGAIVCGSVHQGRHSAALTHLVRENLADFERIPSAFVSVSLAAAVDDEASRSEAASYIDSFLAETGWQPTATLAVAGALLYTRYDYLKRLMMRLISRSRGGQTDTSRDWEYTDWEALRRFVDDFLRRAAAARA